jgi:hypothetical protein
MRCRAQEDVEAVMHKLTILTMGHDEQEMGAVLRMQSVYRMKKAIRVAEQRQRAIIKLRAAAHTLLPLCCAVPPPPRGFAHPRRRRRRRRRGGGALLAGSLGVRTQAHGRSGHPAQGAGEGAGPRRRGRPHHPGAMMRCGGRPRASGCSWSRRRGVGAMMSACVRRVRSGCCVGGRWRG